MSTRAPGPSSRSDEGNRLAYRQHDTVDLIRRRAGWIDVGEKVLINQVADEMRSQPILDIGVGGGRTAWMLRLLSRDYVAVDYSPEMVKASIAEYPGLDVRESDARDLALFDHEAFGLVVFSFNGIDVLDHGGRLTALAEMHRVLRPGGLLLYSTSNKNGPLYGLRPWTRGPASARRFVRFVVFLPKSIPHHWRSYANWWHRRRYNEDHGSWAICTSRAYEFRVVVHWTLPSTERQALESTGFSLEETLGYDGDAVVDDSTTTPYFYVLARKNGHR
jgi:SAM-dependent methyltransferase